MAVTHIGLNDIKAIRKQSVSLAVDTAKKGYFTKKFMSSKKNPSAPIKLLMELESDAGEQITYDLSIQKKMELVEGDDVIEGKEEDLKWATDTLYINQGRGGTHVGGRMSRKRTLHKLRNITRDREADWWARVYDEQFFMYLAGARGDNENFLFKKGYTGRANNAFTAPDPDHIIYAGAAVSKATLTESDKMTTDVIDRCVARSNMMGGGTEETPQIQPIMIDGEEHFCMVMTPYQEYDLRTGTGAANWMEINKAAATAEGRKSPIFKGGLGMHNNVVLHKHKSVISFKDYGAADNVDAGRALFMGSEAAVCAFGSPGTGTRFGWHEETRDGGNQTVINTHSIFGIKKCTYAGKDFGVIAVEAASKNPG